MRALVLVLLVSVSLGAVARAEPAGRVTGKVVVTEADGKVAPGVDVIVYMVGFKEPAAAEPITVTQKGRKFVPDLVAVTVGGAVDFPNADPLLHNVFSQSTARKFDLGSFRKGETKQKSFPTAGVVDVYCNIHPEMAATILVLPNRRHTRAGKDGVFVLDGVPAGNWTVFAYARRAAKPVSAKVTVKPGDTTSIDLAVQRGAETEHRNKFGETYRTDGQNYR